VAAKDSMMTTLRSQISELNEAVAAKDSMMTTLRSQISELKEAAATQDLREKATSQRLAEAAGFIESLEQSNEAISARNAQLADMLAATEIDMKVKYAEKSKALEDLQAKYSAAIFRADAELATASDEITSLKKEVASLDEKLIVTSGSMNVILREKDLRYEELQSELNRSLESNTALMKSLSVLQQQLTEAEANTASLNAEFKQCREVPRVHIALFVRLHLICACCFAGVL
jgi:hypothetical protein